MDLLLDKDKEKSGVNKVLVGAMLIAAGLIAGALWLWTFQPSFEEQKQQQQQIVGAFTEGSPEFESYTKNLVITTDLDRTTESPLGLGTIQMNIQGDIRNKGDKIINGLEVNVSVVDIKNQTIKEKKVKIVPTNQIEKLAPGEITHVIVPMDGFNKKDDRANVRWKVTAIRFE
jgi:hypothetical protein